MVKSVPILSAPPVVEPFAFPTDLTEGRRASVACVVSAGDLPIEIRWLKDGRPPGPELRGHVARANDYTSLLSVPSVAARHAGNYTCLASNPAATASHSAPMVVQGTYTLILEHKLVFGEDLSM
ncbi:hypothetical protein LAZ67_1006499 [Cordylochernes scorpioides]|uniref:Ig-like domain-containing protein n=1 Tax=Cordylochernes scorpioides TaxID=51811 RepID=A0ABY6K053_9ARAC|nr:hypothetical protein LAZ67_1006499 [Cordylochernes scorpioides]